MKAEDFHKMSQGRIVCHQDIVNIVERFPKVTSDQIAAMLPIGYRLQDVLLDMVKDLVVGK